jgi:hypothetical protein
VALEMARNPFHRAGVSKTRQMEFELRKLSQDEPRQKRHLADRKPGPLREPQGS